MSINLGRKKYQKLKASLGMSEQTGKRISDIGYDVIGFLFREILNELIELVLGVVMTRRKTKSCDEIEITSDEIFEACRLHTYYLNDTNTDAKKMFIKSRPCSLRKKYLFF
jgi:hypothetical protein